MKLYPVKLKWKKFPIWIEAENEKAAEGLEYITSLDRPLLTKHETKSKPVEIENG